MADTDILVWLDEFFANIDGLPANATQFSEGPTVEALFQRTIEWAMHTFKNEFQFSSTVNVQRSIDTVAKDMVKLWESGNQGSLWTPDGDAALLAAVEWSEKEEEDDKKYGGYGDILKQAAIKYPERLTGMIKLIEAELRERYAVSEEELKDKTQTEKIKMLAQYRLMSDTQYHFLPRGYKENAGKHEYEICLSTLKGRWSNIWEHNRLFFEYHSSFEEFLHKLQNATEHSDLPANGLSKMQMCPLIKAQLAAEAAYEEFDVVPATTGTREVTASDSIREEVAKEDTEGNIVEEETPETELPIGERFDAQMPIDGVADHEASLDSQSTATDPLASSDTLSSSETLSLSELQDPPDDVASSRIVTKNISDDVSKTKSPIVNVPSAASQLLDAKKNKVSVNEDTAKEECFPHPDHLPTPQVVTNRKGFALHHGPWCWRLDSDEDPQDGWQNIAEKADYDLMIGILRAKAGKSLPSKLMKVQIAHSQDKDANDCWKANEDKYQREAGLRERAKAIDRWSEFEEEMYLGSQAAREEKEKRSNVRKYVDGCFYRD